MKKFLCVCMALLLLSGCAVYDNETFNSQMNEYLTTLNDDLDVRINNHTEYYSYYLPSDMSEGECYEEGILLKYSNSKIILNINVAALVSKTFYSEEELKDEGFFDSARLFYEASGTYRNEADEDIAYFVHVYDNTDNVLIHLMSGEFNMYAYSLKEEAYETIKHMFLIARSATIEKEDILANYSKSDVISIKRKQVDLFQYVIPKSGYLSELMIENETE